MRSIVRSGNVGPESVSLLVAGMAGNNGGSGSIRVSGASISAAATTTEPRFHQREIRQRRWRGCFGGFSCFGSQKGRKRIVPASRIVDGNTSSRGNGSQNDGHANQSTTTNLSLIAPPSSPASFSNSALPSTAQSPACFLSISANSPGGPQSTMFATGPYAHETQLVSPPVFSTSMTEPSTAPLTPPPELAHLTTPSSPDVPFAKFLSSSGHYKGAGKANGVHYLFSSYQAGSDLQTSYPLYPGSPSSSLISPASGTPRTGLSTPLPEREVSSQWNTSTSAGGSPYSRNGSSKFFGLESGTARNLMLCPDSSYLYPATSARFYLDQVQQSVRLSVSRDMDTYPCSVNNHAKPSKQDVEELEAYRASFGFSADEIVTTQNNVEISDAADVSFTVSPFANSKAYPEQCPITDFAKRCQQTQMTYSTVPDAPKQISFEPSIGIPDNFYLHNARTGSNGKHQSEQISPSMPQREETYVKVLDRQGSRRNRPDQSCSDAEIDYERAISLREANGILARRDSLP